MLDVKPFVIGDAMADFSREKHLESLEYIAGRCGNVKSVKTALNQLNLKAAGDESVKALSLESLRRDVADILLLSLEEVEVDENLTYLGLDSIRAMALLDKWRSQGVNLTFAQIASASTLSQWWQIINQAQRLDASIEDVVA